MVWLYRVAKSRCLMSRRKSKFAPRGVLSLEELMPDRQKLRKLSGNSDGTPETSLLRRENAKRLREAVRRLPPEYLSLVAFGARRRSPHPPHPGLGSDHCGGTRFRAIL